MSGCEMMNCEDYKDGKRAKLAEREKLIEALKAQIDEIEAAIRSLKSIRQQLRQRLCLLILRG